MLLISSNCSTIISIHKRSFKNYLVRAIAMKKASAENKKRKEGHKDIQNPDKGPGRAEEGAKKQRKASETFDEFIKRIEGQRINAGDIVSFQFQKTRCKNLSEEERLSSVPKTILYWMSRDQRVQDNWALLFAQRKALKEKVPLCVCFCLVPKFLDATLRMYGFMLRGLESVREELHQLGIPFHLIFGEPHIQIPLFVKEFGIGGIITDFSPLRVPQSWANELVRNLPKDVPLCQVDTHNIVPIWVTSNKQEYAARTIRPKINSNLPKYLTEFPAVIQHPHNKSIDLNKISNPFADWNSLITFLEIDKTVKEVEWAKPGTIEAFRVLKIFLDKKLNYFAKNRNDPNEDALSNLSPWFHFGQISVARCILEVKRSAKGEGPDSFIEESVVRRELSDNFCFYNPNYDSLEGATDWAKKTLNDHRKDKRDPMYVLEDLEKGLTYDDLWNAAQIQMVQEGKMHGFLRMYWAKKILEWTESPEKALEIAIYLNDKYSLDGRDPNGYVGCMWSICGVHDQGWSERPIFGKIRFMNYAGCKRKFSIEDFVAKYPSPDAPKSKVLTSKSQPQKKSTKAKTQKSKSK